MNLGDIANIRTGLVLSRKKPKIESSTKAKYRLFTIKNITEDGLIENDSFEEFFSNDELDEQYFTKEGDILMRLSYPYTAVNIEKQHTGLLIPSYFSIIKVDQSKYLPEFITWYLNSNEVKKELERSQSGSRIPSTNSNVLKRLPVVKITLSKQKALIELIRLQQKEKMLYQKLLQEKEMWFRGLIKGILKNSNEEEV